MITPEEFHQFFMQAGVKSCEMAVEECGGQVWYEYLWLSDTEFQLGRKNCITTNYISEGKRV